MKFVARHYLPSSLAHSAVHAEPHLSLEKLERLLRHRAKVTVDFERLSVEEEVEPLLQRGYLCRAGVPQAKWLLVNNVGDARAAPPREGGTSATIHAYRRRRICTDAGTADLRRDVLREPRLAHRRFSSLILAVAPATLAQ